MLTRNFKSKGGEGSHVRELPSGEDGSRFPKDVPGQVTGWRRKWEKTQAERLALGFQEGPGVQGKISTAKRAKEAKGTRDGAVCTMRPGTAGGWPQQDTVVTASSCYHDTHPWGFKSKARSCCKGQHKGQEAMVTDLRRDHLMPVMICHISDLKETRFLQSSHSSVLPSDSPSKTGTSCPELLGCTATLQREQGQRKIRLPSRTDSFFPSVSLWKVLESGKQKQWLCVIVL